MKVRRKFEKCINFSLISNCVIFNILAGSNQDGKGKDKKGYSGRGGNKNEENNEQQSSQVLDKNQEEKQELNKEENKEEKNNGEDIKRQKELDDARRKAEELNNLKTTFTQDVTMIRTTLSSVNNKYYSLKSDLTFDDSIINCLNETNKDDVKQKIDKFKANVDGFIKTIKDKLVEKLKEFETKLDKLKKDPEKSFIADNIKMDDISEGKIKGCKDEEIDGFYNKLQGLEVAINGDVNEIRNHYENEYKKVNSELVEYFKNDDIKNKYNSFKTNIDSFDNLNKFNDLSKSCTDFFAAINEAINNKNSSNNTNINTVRNNISNLKYEDTSKNYVKDVIDFSKTTKDYSTLESKIELNSNNEYLTKLDTDIKDLEKEYNDNADKMKKKLNDIRYSLIDIYQDILDGEHGHYKKEEKAISDFLTFIELLKRSVNKYKEDLSKSDAFTEEELKFSLPIYQCFDNTINEENINIKYKDEDFYSDNFTKNVLEKEKTKKYVIKKSEDLEVYKDIFKFINNIFNFGDYKFCKDNGLKKYTYKPCSGSYYGHYYILKFDYLDSDEVETEKIKESLKNYNDLMTNDVIKTKLLELIDEFIKIFTDLKDYSKKTEYVNCGESKKFKDDMSKNLNITCEIFTLLKELLNTDVLNSKIVNKLKKNIDKLKSDRYLGDILFNFYLNRLYFNIIYNGYCCNIFSKRTSPNNIICNSIDAYKFYNGIIEKLYDIKNSEERKTNFESFVMEQIKFMKCEDKSKKTEVDELIDSYRSTYSGLVGKYFNSSIINNCSDIFKGTNYPKDSDKGTVFENFDCYEECENYKKQLDSVVYFYNYMYKIGLTTTLHKECYENFFNRFAFFFIENLATFIEKFEKKEKEDKTSAK